jgi:hypothetical protein
MRLGSSSVGDEQNLRVRDWQLLKALSNKPMKRRPVNSWSTITQPGPRGLSGEGRPPRRPGSATIDHHLRPSPLIGKPLDTRDRLWRRWVSGDEGRQLAGGDAMLLTMTVAAPVTGSAAMVGGGAISCLELGQLRVDAGIDPRAADFAKPTSGCGAQALGPRTGQRSRTLDRHPRHLGADCAELSIRLGVDGRCGPSAAVPMSNMPLQMTRAVQLSVDGQPAGAARLTR